MSCSALKRIAAGSLLGLVLVAGARPGWTQDAVPGYSIDQLTQRVLIGNSDLQATALARDAARSASMAALALPNPKLDVSGGARCAARIDRWLVFGSGVWRLSAD